ncbi:MAG: hypothetical protein PHQ86_03065 [Dehalococcoidales bacterium]|nr:hypothetical protein [Dehalococcoidales bacterium]
MTHGDWLILMGMGGLFLFLGIVAFIRSRQEEKSYYDSISVRPDAREFLEHKPDRPEPGALVIGGWLLIAIGLLMIIMASAFLIWG